MPAYAAGRQLERRASRLHSEALQKRPLSSPAPSKELSKALQLAGISDTSSYQPAMGLPAAVETSAAEFSEAPGVAEVEDKGLAERLAVPPQPVAEPKETVPEPSPAAPSPAVPEPSPAAPAEVAQTDPPAPDPDQELARNLNRMPIVSLPSDGFDAPLARWSRLPSKGSPYIALAASPSTYDVDYSIFFLDSYDQVSNPGQEVIVWDFLSPVTERNLTARNSASSVQFRYTSTGQALTVEQMPEYNLEVTVWDRRFPEGKVINGAKESSPLVRDSLSFYAGVSARDSGTWTLKRTRNGQALPNESFQVTKLAAIQGAQWKTFAAGAYSPESEDRSFEPYDEFLVHSKPYTLAPLLQDIVPNPEEPDPIYTKQGEVFWHWYSPLATDNTTALTSHLSIQLLYRQDATATLSLIRTKVWDSRYPNGRITEYQQVSGTPPENYTLLYGTGLLRAGPWQLQEIVNAGPPTIVTATGSAPAGLPPANGDNTGRPTVDLAPPQQDFRPVAGANQFIVDTPAPPIVAGMTTYAGVELRDAATNQVLATDKYPILTQTPHITSLTFPDLPVIPPGTVVVARPFVSIEEGLAQAKAPDIVSDEDDHRLAFTGWEEGRLLETLGGGWKPSQGEQVAQVSLPPNSIQYFGSGNLHPQLVIPPDAAARQYVSVPGSVTQEVDTVTGRTRHSVTDMALKTRGLPIVITRHFNSGDVSRLPARGWTYSYERSIDLFGTNAEMTYRNADGTSERFVQAGGGRWNASPKSAMEGAYITNDSATEFSVTYKSGVKEVFSSPLNGPRAALLKKEIDRNGNANVYEWNANGTRLVSITDPAGRKVLFTWYAEGLPSTITDWTSRKVEYVYNEIPSGALLLTRVIDTDGVPTRYDYALDKRPNSMSPEGSIYHLVGVKQPAGYQDRLIPSFKTKALGVLSQVVTGQGTRTVLSQSGVPNQPITNTTLTSSGVGVSPRSSSVTFDPVLRPAQVRDPLSNFASFQYDPNSRLTSFLNPEGQILRYTWDATGNPATAKDPRGITTTFTWTDNNLTQVDRPNALIDKFTYDGNKNMLTAIDPENHVTTYDYGAFGLLSSMTNNDGVTWLYGYDDNGYLSSITLPADGEPAGGEPKWLFTNDALGRRTEVTDPRGNKWKYTYDAKDRVTLVTFPDNSTNKFIFDNNNLLKTTIDQQNNRTEYKYNAALQVIEVTQVVQPGEPPTGRTVKYRYDAYGRVSRLTNPLNVDTVYTYDPLDRPTTIVYPGQITERFTYDKIGKLTKFVKGDGTELAYTYDLANRLTKLEHPSLSTPISHTYDDNNRRLTMTDATGTTTWTYNKNSQPISVEAPETGIIGYAYDNLGRLEKVTDPQELETTYTYNSRDQMASASLDDMTVSYVYDDSGNLTGKNLPNGVVCNTTYDNLNRPERMEYALGMAAPLFSEDYTYLKSGNLKQVKTHTTGTPNKVLRYEYDNLYQLTKVEKKNADLWDVAESFAYDIHGNRTSQGATIFANNNADQLLTAGSTAITYDGNGNHEKIDKAAVERTYTFDYADLPTAINEGPTTVARYTYDGDKKRVARETGGGDNLRYLWSGSEIVKEYKSDDSVKAQYLMGMGREGIKGEDGQWHFYLSDRLGTTRFLTNSTGAKSASYEYDAYGKESTSGQSVYNPFRYTGQQWDNHESHLYLRNRYYQPELGRFLVRDPIRYDAGTNMYAYCGNNPINAVDPMGTDAWVKQNVTGWFGETMDWVHYPTASSFVQGYNSATKVDTVVLAQHCTPDRNGISLYPGSAELVRENKKVVFRMGLDSAWGRKGAQVVDIDWGKARSVRILSCYSAGGYDNMELKEIHRAQVGRVGWGFLKGEMDSRPASDDNFASTMASQYRGLEVQGVQGLGWFQFGKWGSKPEPPSIETDIRTYKYK